MTIITQKKSGMQKSLRQRGIFLMRKNSNYQKIKFMNLHASNDIAVNICKITEKYQELFCRVIIIEIDFNIFISKIKKIYVIKVRIQM